MLITYLHDVRPISCARLDDVALFHLDCPKSKLLTQHNQEIAQYRIFQIGCPKTQYLFIYLFFFKLNRSAK